MKIKIQNTNEAITVQEEWPSKETCRKVIRDLSEVNKDFFDVAQKFFESFPRFKEIVFNTELTEDGKNNN